MEPLRAPPREPWELPSSAPKAGRGTPAVGMARRLLRSRSTPATSRSNSNAPLETKQQRQSLQCTKADKLNSIHADLTGEFPGETEKGRAGFGLVRSMLPLF